MLSYKLFILYFYRFMFSIVQHIFSPSALSVKGKSLVGLFYSSLFLFQDHKQTRVKTYALHCFRPFKSKISTILASQPSSFLICSYYLFLSNQAELHLLIYKHTFNFVMTIKPIKCSPITSITSQIYHFMDLHSSLNFFINSKFKGIYKLFKFL